MWLSFLRRLRPGRRSDGFGPEHRDVRPLPAAIAVLVAVAAATVAPAGSAPVRGAPMTVVLVAAPVGEGAQQTMPAALWLRLVSQYVGRAKIVTDAEATMPDAERCRAAHAAYAVLATFDRLPRLPGMAQDTDRAYAIARFTVRNCATGEVMPARIVRLESDPPDESVRAGDEAGAEQRWAHAVQLALAHQSPLLPRAANAAKSSPAPKPTATSTPTPTSTPSPTAMPSPVATPTAEPAPTSSPAPRR
jgi:hypothetical protein